MSDLDSPRSSRSSSPLELPADTLAILNGFLAEAKEKEEDYAAFAQGGGQDLDVDAFKELFGENWQLSQFWYSRAFADRLAAALHQLCTPDTRIAFLCSPTAYVAFQHYSRLETAFCFEYDQRFDLFKKNYVHYNLHEPDALPDDLIGRVDIAVVDPPFLNQETNDKVAQSLRKLFHAQSKLILLTSTSVRDILPCVYDAPPVGPLVETGIKVEHQKSQLSNPFGVWTNFDAGWSI